jgi:hypothetical protein
MKDYIAAYHQAIQDTRITRPGIYCDINNTLLIGSEENEK